MTHKWTAEGRNAYFVLEDILEAEVMERIPTWEEAVEQWSVKPQAMYEASDGTEIPFYRCDGGMECDACGVGYRSHPEEPREECLTVLCDGRRVKL